MARKGSEGMPGQALLHALTIDVEDYFQVSGFERQVRREDWENYPSRVVASTMRLLEILDEHQIKATFYILGWVADRFPHLARDIFAAGHEIGSHSYWHRLIYHLSPADFRRDLRQSRDLLADQIGVKVTTYRAPSFSITRDSTWALEILAAEGFESDSSIFPTRHDRYGIPGAPQRIFQIQTAAGPVWEFPMAVADVAGLQVPVSGGGYFRLYPLAWTIRWLRQIETTGRPFLFYLHPWEIDPDQPRLSAGSSLSRWRHRVNLHRTEEKLRSLLKAFRFGRVCDVLDAAQKAGPITTSITPLGLI
jgi:polysaccharide deacetylase family protein (PEP-CTERM system associated)